MDCLYCKLPMIHSGDEDLDHDDEHFMSHVFTCNACRSMAVFYVDRAYGADPKIIASDCSCNAIYTGDCICNISG